MDITSLLRLLIEQLNSAVFFLLFIFIGFLFAFWKLAKFLGKWEEKTSSLNQWNKDIPYLKERIDIIFTRSHPNSFFKINSPARLTPIGQKVSKALEANKIIDRNLYKLKKLVKKTDPQTAYDLQKTCFMVVEKNIESMLSVKEIDIAKKESIKNGVPLDHTLSLFAILLRDILKKEKRNKKQI